MELSREVHTLLERIKKLSQHTQKNEKNETNSNTHYNLPMKISHLNINSSVNTIEDVQFSTDDLINVDSMDFSDNERWLYVSEMSMISPYTGDLTNWLHQDFNTVEDDISELESLNTEARKNIVDTRTFTRPKKRISRPSLEQLTEGCYSQSSSKTSITGSYHDVSKLSLTEESSNESYHSDYLLSNTNSVTGNNVAAPVQFKLSEPVNISFDKILANAGESLDSFTNMSPPSLMNSLCSSTFTNLMDSGYVNQPEIVPNVNDDLSMRIMQTSINENVDPNVTYSNNSKTFKDDTYELKNQNISNTQLNGTFTLELNSSFQKNTTNLSGTNTIVKKSKLSNISNSLKASCPDINRTFQKSHDTSLDLTFQKLSDSQPNLTEDLKRTIFNQSMELMNPTETYHTARSGSADSLDDRSSSISNSSKDSGTKILNMGDLDNLAKAQELRLHQAMSTPKPSKSRMLLLETLSPIPVQSHHVAADEEFFSDSDQSDTCMSARSGFSRAVRVPASSALASGTMDLLTRPDLNATKSLPNKPEVRKPSLRFLPTMVVKPMEVNRTIVEPNRIQSAQAARPKIRMSGLPRPTSSLPATGIPRPTSRIPGPKTLRPPSARPHPQQRPPPKTTNWMDGCY